jgi:molybdopterin-guanine dinucleotide biosynthesis protein A
MAEAVTGLILAGGKSRRFGTDKAYHLIAAKPMIEVVFTAMAEVVDPIWISVQDATKRYPISIPHIPDVYPGCGPLGGVHAGLKAARTPWVLVVACDMPHVTPEVIRAIIECTTEEFDVIVACDDNGRRHPVCACYSTSIVSIIEEHLEADSYAMMALLEKLKVREVAVADSALQNINSPIHKK